MAKYYIQCGPIRVVRNADSIENAAMLGLEKSFQTHLWIYDDVALSEQDCHDHLMLEAILHLAPEVQVSERGFDRDDAVCVGTPESVDRWHHLIVGMRRLFVAAGLGERSMTQMVDAPSTPRSCRRRPR